MTHDERELISIRLHPGSAYIAFVPLEIRGQCLARLDPTDAPNVADNPCCVRGFSKALRGDCHECRRSAEFGTWLVIE